MSLHGDLVRNPVIMAVDDDLGVLHAVERDLSSHYSGRFRILAAESGESALEALRDLKVRGDAVALLVVDQRMPAMSGMELIAKLRGQDIATPAVLIVSQPNVAISARAAKIGVPVVEKPFLGNGLVEKIRHACRPDAD